MPYNEEWDEEEIIDTDNKDENTLMYTKLGNDSLIDLTGNNGLINSTSNVLDGLYATCDDAIVPGQEALSENRLKQLSTDINPFQLLQTDHKANCNEIKAACDKLLRVHHSVKNSHPDDKETTNKNFCVTFISLKKLLNVAAKKRVKRRLFAHTKAYTKKGSQKTEYAHKEERKRRKEERKKAFINRQKERRFTTLPKYTKPFNIA